MIPAKYETIVFQFLISGIMSFLVSGTATLRVAGLEDFSLVLWLNAWLPAWAVAFPTIVVMAPVVRAITRKLVTA